MEGLNEESKVVLNNLIAIVDNIQSEMYKLKIDRISDSFLIKHLDFYEKEIDRVKIMIAQSPRFKWQFIQQEIDLLFKKDNSLTGVNIFLDWKDCVVHNRTFLNFKI